MSDNTLTGIVALPTSADVWTDVASVTVPANARRIDQLAFSAVPDWGATAGSIRSANIFRLQNSGIAESDPHIYFSEFASSATVTTGGAAHFHMVKKYVVDVPVNPGSTITVQVDTLDEVVTAGTAMFFLGFDSQNPTSGNSNSDENDAASTTTADSWVAIGTAGAAFIVPRAAGRGRRDPRMIRRLHFGVAPDQGTTAISIRVAPRFRITGDISAGLHEFMGPCAFTGQLGTTPSQGAYLNNMTLSYDVAIPVAAGGRIGLEHRFEVETPTAGTAAAGLEYWG